MRDPLPSAVMIAEESIVSSLSKVSIPVKFTLPPSWAMSGLLLPKVVSSKLLTVIIDVEPVAPMLAAGKLIEEPT